MAHKNEEYSKMYRAEGKHKAYPKGKRTPPDLDYMRKEMRMSGKTTGTPPKGEPVHNPNPKGSRYPSTKANEIAKN